MNHCKTDLGIQNRPLHAEICQSSARACTHKFATSALPPISRHHSGHVLRSALGPFATKSTATNSCLFDHLGGESEQRRRHVEPERLRGLEIDDSVELSRCLHWQVGGPLALEDSVDVAGG